MTGCDTRLPPSKRQPLSLSVAPMPSCPPNGASHSKGKSPGKVLTPLGEHLTRRARGAEIWPPIPTKQTCLPPRGFLSVGAILGGGKAEAFPGKHTVKAACGARAARVTPLCTPCTCARQSPCCATLRGAYNWMSFGLQVILPTRHAVAPSHSLTAVPCVKSPSVGSQLSSVASKQTC